MTLFYLAVGICRYTYDIIICIMYIRQLKLNSFRSHTVYGQYAYTHLAMSITDNERRAFRLNAYTLLCTTIIIYL